MLCLFFSMSSRVFLSCWRSPHRCLRIKLWKRKHKHGYWKIPRESKRTRRSLCSPDLWLDVDVWRGWWWGWWMPGAGGRWGRSPAAGESGSSGRGGWRWWREATPLWGCLSGGKVPESQHFSLFVISQNTPECCLVVRHHTTTNHCCLSRLWSCFLHLTHWSPDVKLKV